MKQRILTGLVLIGILIPVLLLSGTVAFPIVAASFCLISVYEMLRCLGTHRILPIAIPAYCLAVGLPLGLIALTGVGEGLVLLPVDIYGAVLYLLLAAALSTLYMFLLFIVAVFGRRSIAFADIASSFMMTFYIVLAFVAIPLLRFGKNGQYYYLLCFIGPWITDIFAYFTGVFFGRHKLIPEISPKKTVEGCLGGVVFCALSYVIFGFAVGALTGLSPNYLMLAVVGVSVSFISQIGDLVASLIKREHNVKDYGNIFPGHGGVLDRFDSFIAAAPLLLIVCTVDGLFNLNLLL